MLISYFNNEHLVEFPNVTSAVKASFISMPSGILQLSNAYGQIMCLSIKRWKNRDLCDIKCEHL